METVNMMEVSSANTGLSKANQVGTTYRFIYLYIMNGDISAVFGCKFLIFPKLNVKGGFLLIILILKYIFLIKVLLS